MFDFSSKFFCYLIAALLCGNVAVAQTTSGSYLAASSAQSQHDYAAAARYYVQTISNDPGNLRVMTQGMSAFLAAGDVDRALVIAKPISQSGQNIALAEFLLLAQDFRTGTFDAAFDRLNNNTIAGASIDQMLVGWALMGQGQVSDALMAFDEGAQVDGMRSFALYQKALALALVGDFEGAEAIFAGDLAAPVAATLRGSLARAQILAQLDRGADAADYLTQVHGENGDPQAMALRARLLAGAAVDFDIVQDASEGGGEVLFNIASALRGENGDDGLLFYVRLATYLAPQNVHAVLLTAEILEGLGNYELATQVYDLVPRSHPVYVAAEMGRAEGFFALGQPKLAIEVMQDLAKEFPNNQRVHATLGDMLRRDEQYVAAVSAYDTAINMIATPRQHDWLQYYVRAIAYERLGNWPRAEADFRAALRLSPTQYQVLNYLGYSLVERGENLEEALDMIKAAVASQPDAGFIIDSLGWVQFQMGQYTDAVINMERAAELMATDPVVNDHLGDTYWAVGRRVEARFQWRRALSFVTDHTDLNDIDPARVRRKLEVGLDQVLVDEGAAPLKVENEN